MKTFKTQIFPTTWQRKYFEQSFGIRRSAWNWAVATYFKTAEEKDDFLSSFDLDKLFRTERYENPKYSYLKDVNSMVWAEAFKDFGLSIKAYSKKQKEARRTVVKVNSDKYKPSFKKKGKCVDSFRYTSKSLPSRVAGRKDLWLTTTRELKRTKLRLAEPINWIDDKLIKTTTISKKAGKYYISLVYEKPNHKPRKKGTGTVGLDMGIKHIAVSHDGVEDKVFDAPSTLDRAERKTERLNQKLAASQKGSKRRSKIKLSLQKAYEKEANIKKDFREKMTTMLVENYHEIKLDMFEFEHAKALDVNRSLYRVGIYAFKERLTTKALERGNSVKFVPKGTPTTQTCSHCAHVQTNKLTLADRTFKCESYNIVLDRDANSARNTYKLHIN